MDELPTRWEIELEYLQYLAQMGKLQEQTFLNYLDYLEYWRDPKYAQFLIYPNCLHILTLLKSPQFREQISRQDLTELLFNDMVNRWKEPIDEKPQEDDKQEQSEQDQAQGQEDGVKKPGQTEPATETV
ncbi:unnamed protein product [Kuraishia capsulata CBS 1993]|uniref:Mediator of RNA polymerase II transcription subunit 31 n=1 Tax=Kuraishia capsulata CBS 1993 TaxID=1382522 RepID=W6MII6_9ASCO|nr:uncharacterized protein KUCA_T00001932001 [Kuraishia capsulata CBS 1993]CDK25961.1 unnamed protein product [Kuraishia capsulata CBS 1993]